MMSVSTNIVSIHDKQNENNFNNSSHGALSMMADSHFSKNLVIMVISFSSLPLISDQEYEINVTKTEKTEDILKRIVNQFPSLRFRDIELVEVLTSAGEICKERIISNDECPARIQLLWPRMSINYQSSEVKPSYSFVLRLLKHNIKRNSVMNTEWTNSVGPNSRISMHDKSPIFQNFLNKTSLKDYQDLCQLPDLNEQTLLDSLKKRFNRELIYTYVGSILIAINPFRYLPIYNPKQVDMYRNKRLSELPPHVFAIADTAFHSMLYTKTNQCIVISGESGSGKTETANLLLHHLSSFSQRSTNGNCIEKSITGVGPVLEAFGNAKTVHNDNSSRFGKFVQVFFGEGGTLNGASVEKYLLEKSRIVSQALNERNYHVFYYLLSGINQNLGNSNEFKILQLGFPEEYYYLNQNGQLCFDSTMLKSEAKEFERLRNAMDTVGFSSESQKKIFIILSAVLHIGNIKFDKKNSDDYVTVTNSNEVTIVSQLLKVSETTLINALTKRRTLAGGETVIMSNKMEEANSTRDATAKCLYNVLFEWIVYQINIFLLSKHENQQNKGKCIGVLDIFGFEDFSVNSFEQFCINYANENLHYYFNQHIFKLEQEEYRVEGIEWANIDYIDNTACLALFNKKPSGLLHLLDEESNFPGASDETLLSKFHKQHSSSNYYDMPLQKLNTFSIVHYAGIVKYTITGFREKNNDLMRNDVLTLLKSSNFIFVRELIGQDAMALLRWNLVRIFFSAYFAFKNAGKRHIKSSSSNLRKYGAAMEIQKKAIESTKICQYNSNMKYFDDLNRRSSCPSSKLDQLVSPIIQNYNLTLNSAQLEFLRDKNKSSKIHNDVHFNSTAKIPLSSRLSKSKNKSPSISAQFHISLTKLTATLNKANPFFIRCIKSNAKKAALFFDEELVQRQLKYTGMLATVKIRQSGYNYRLSFEDFICKFYLLLPNGQRSSKEEVEKFLKTVDVNRNNYQIGKTKIFLREAEKVLLEELVNQVFLKKVLTIQTWYRAQHLRNKFMEMKMSAITLQKTVRIFMLRRKIKNIKKQSDAATIIQKFYKARKNHISLNKEDIEIHPDLKNTSTPIKPQIFFSNFNNIQSENYSEKVRKTIPTIRNNNSSMIIDNIPFIKSSSHDNLKNKTKDIDYDISQNLVHSEVDGLMHSINEFKQKPTVILNKFRKTMKSTDSDFDNQLNEEETVISVSDSEKILYKNENKNVKDDKTVEYNQNSESDVKSPKQYDNKHSDVTSNNEMKPSSIGNDNIETNEVKRCANKLLDSKDVFINLDSSLINTNVFNVDDTTGRISSYSNNYLIENEKNRIKNNSLKEDKLCNILNIDTSSNDDVIKDEDKLYNKLNIDISLNDDVIAEEDVLTELEYKNLLRSKKKSHISSNSISNKYTGSLSQEGPKDLEVHLEAVIHKNDESINSFSSSKSEAFKERPIRAPIARPESFTEPASNTFLNNLDYEVHTIEIDDEDEISSAMIKSPIIQLPIISQNIDKPIKQVNKSEGNTSWRNKYVRSHKNNQNVREKKWVVSGTAQWTYPIDNVVTNIMQLKQLENFLTSKTVYLGKLSSERGKDSMYDEIFKATLDEFHKYLITQISTASEDEKYTYERLMFVIEGMLKMKLLSNGIGSDFPFTFVINAFRGFLDEFIKKRDNKELPEIKNKAMKKSKKKENILESNDHKFLLILFSIPTYCEHCSSTLWVLEHGYTCKTCKFTIHKKCIKKLTHRCRGSISQASLASRTGRMVIGAPLSLLMENIVEEQKIPTIIERLIRAIEEKGLYTEGIYRKVGNSTVVKDLIKQINADPEKIVFDNYQIHCLTSVFKTFFREMPEPLMTYELYQEIIRIPDIPDANEKANILYSVISKLPNSNYHLLERLIFHLATIAKLESINRMSASGLAIIFAPGIIRTSQQLPMQESLLHVPRQSKCIELLIELQMDKIERTMEDIKSIDENIAQDEQLNMGNDDTDASSNAIIRIETMRKKRDVLTNHLSTFEYNAMTSDDEAFSNEDGDQNIEDEDSLSINTNSSTDNSITWRQDKIRRPVKKLKGYHRNLSIDSDIFEQQMKESSSELNMNSSYEVNKNL